MEMVDEEYDVCPKCGYIHGTPPEIINHLYPGMTLNDGRYLVGTVANYGGFGVVYRAWDMQLEIMVAIKECFPPSLVTRTPGDARVALLSGGARRTQFLNQMNLLLEEAKNTAKFEEHPNIVHVFSRFTDNGTAYMVMEYMDGVTLKSYLKQHGGKLDVDTTVTILLSIIQALKEVHKCGILHRDIAPDNIFILRDGTVKLFDFGAGKFLDEDKNLQRENVVKPGYAPPEQYDDKSPQGAWTDIYALAATMYRCITGVVPAESTDRQAALYNKENDLLLPPKEIDSSIPDYIDSSLMRAMSITPRFRFQTVEAFEEAILNQKTFRSEEQERKYLLKRRIISVACVGLVILAGAVYGLIDYHTKKQAANLEKTTITVWMPVDGDGEAEAQEEFEGMIVDFQTDYPQVTIDVSYVPEEEYQNQLEEAFEQKMLPTVFDAEYMTADMEEDCATIDDVVSLLNKDEYYFLKDYAQVYTNKKVLPTGFSVPVVYGNTVLMDSKTVQKTNDEIKYLAKENTFFIGSSGEYELVQESIPGVYVVMPVLGEEVAAFYTDIWSVSAQGNQAQINAGKRLLYYFLGERAQDVYFVQHMEGLPMNKTMLEAYMDVNGEMDFLGDYAERAEIDGEQMAQPEDYYNELYSLEFQDSSEMLTKLQNWIEEGE
jgi:serine/threonine protein kinase